MNYVNLHVTCVKKYRSSRSIIKILQKNRVMYEKTDKTNFLRDQASNRVSLASNKLYLPLYYIQICVFLFIQHFCTWFCYRPIAAAVGWAPAGRATPCHDPGWPQPPMQRSGHAMAPASHSTQRLRPSRTTAPAGCAKAVVVPGRPRQATAIQQPPSKLKENIKK
jgi:hypothetical protein